MGDLTLEKGGGDMPLDLLSGLEHLESEKQLNVSLELVKNLATAWQRVKTSLEQNTIVSVNDVLRQLLLYTAYTVLDAKYTNKIENSTKTILTDAIQGVEKFVIDPNLKKVCSALNSLCGNPWEYAAFKDAATKELSVQVIDSLWENEGVIFLEARLEVLGRGKKLKDSSAIFMSKILHILLYKGRTKFILENNKEKNSLNFDPYQFNFHQYLEYLEIYILLWSKVKAAFATNVLTDLSPSIISEVISMLKQKSAARSKGRLLPKLWKENTKDILIPLISLVLPPILDRVCEVGHVKSLITLRLEICTDNNPDPIQQLEEMLDDLCLEKMKTSDYIYALSEIILEKFGHANKDTRRHYVNTFLKAILKDMNVIENLRADTPQDPVKLQEEYFRLSNRFVTLSNYFQDFKNMSRQLKLTAFSLNPTEKLFKELFPSDDESSTSQIETAPTPPNTGNSNQHDSDATAPHLSLISSFATEGSAKTEKSENMSQPEDPSPEEEEDLQLPDTLVDDLNSVSQTSRWGALRSFTKGPEVKRLCTQLLKAGSDFLVKEKELEFVNPNYQKYAHLPVKYDDHDGFERNFYDPNKHPKGIGHRKNINGKIRGNNFVKRRIQNATNINRKVGQLSWKGNHHTDLRKTMKNVSINHLTRPSTSSSKKTSRPSFTHSRNEYRNATNTDLAQVLTTIKQFVNVSNIKNQRRYQQVKNAKNYENKFCYPKLPMPGSYNWIPDPKPLTNSIPSSFPSFTKGESQPGKSQPVRKAPTRYIPKKISFQATSGWQYPAEDEYPASVSKLARGFVQEDARKISVRTQIDLRLPEIKESEWMAVEEKRNIDMYPNLKLMSSRVKLNSNEIPVELTNLTARYLSLKSEQLSQNGHSGDHDARRTERSLGTTSRMQEKVWFRKMVFKNDNVPEFQFGVIVEMEVSSKRINPSHGPSRVIKRQVMVKDATKRMKTNLELETYKWKEVLDNAKREMRTESETSRWPKIPSACNITGVNLTQEQIGNYRAEEPGISRYPVNAFRGHRVNKKDKTQPELSIPSSVIASSGRSSVDSTTMPSTHRPSPRGSKRRASSNVSREEHKYLHESDSDDSSSSSSYSTSAYVAGNKRRYKYYPDRVIYSAIIAMLRGKTMKDAAEMNGIGRSALCKRLHVMKIREKGQLVIPPHLLEAMNVDAEGNSLSTDVSADRKRKAYSEADLHEAIGLVVFRNLSCKSASVKTSVPAPTIQFYCNNIKNGVYTNDSHSVTEGNPDDKLLEPSQAGNARSLEESHEDYLPALKLFGQGKGKTTLKRAAMLSGISFEKLVDVVDRFKVSSDLRKPGRKMSLDLLDVDKSNPSPSHGQINQQEGCSTQLSHVSLLNNAIQVATVSATPPLVPTSETEIPPPIEKPKEKPRTTVNLAMLHNPIFRQSAESISGKPLAIPSTRPKKEILDDSTGEIKMVDDTGDDPLLDKIIATLPPWRDDVVLEKEKEILVNKNENDSDVILVEKKTVEKEEDVSQSKVIYHSVTSDPTPQNIVEKVYDHNNLNCRVFLSREEVQKYLNKHSTVPTTSSSSNCSLSPSLPSSEIIPMESSSTATTTEVKRSRRIHSMPKIIFKSGIPTRISELNSVHPIEKDPTINGVIVASSNKRKPEEVTVQQNGDSSSSNIINKKRRVDKEKENLFPVSTSIAAAVAAVVTTAREPTISPATIMDGKIVEIDKVQNVARKRTQRPRRQRRRRISSSSTSSHSLPCNDLGGSMRSLLVDEGKKSPDDDDFDDFEDETSDEDKDKDPDYIPDEMDQSSTNNKKQRNFFDPVLSFQTKPVECTPLPPIPQDLNFANIISNTNTVCSLRTTSSSDLTTSNFPLPVINIRTSHHTPLIIANNNNKPNQPPQRVFSTPAHPAMTHTMNIFQIEEAEEFIPPVVSNRRPTKKLKTIMMTTNGNNLPTQMKPTISKNGGKGLTQRQRIYAARNRKVKKIPQIPREDPLLEVINLSDSDDEADEQPQIIHQNGNESILITNQEAIFSDDQPFSFLDVRSSEYRIVPDNDDDDDNEHGEDVREILITDSQQQQQLVEIGGPIACGIDSTEIISFLTTPQLKTQKKFASIEDELSCEFRDKNSVDGNVETRMSSYPSSKPGSRQTSETDVSEISTFSSSSNNSPHQSEGELESGTQYTNVAYSLDNCSPQFRNNEFYASTQINPREGSSANQEGDNFVASNIEKNEEMRKTEPTHSPNRMENTTQLSQTSIPDEDNAEEIIRRATVHDVSSPFQNNRQFPSPPQSRSVSPPIESKATPNTSVDPIESELSFLFEEKEASAPINPPSSSPIPQQLQNFDIHPNDNDEPDVSPHELPTSSLGSPPIPILEPETNQTPPVGEGHDDPPKLSKCA